MLASIAFIISNVEFLLFIYNLAIISLISSIIFLIKSKKEL